MAWRATGIGEKVNASLLLSGGYIGLHIFLDAVSSTHGLAYLGITPWNPPSGLALAFLLLAGFGHLPTVALACLLADYLIRGEAAFHLSSSLTYALAFSGAYAFSILLLRRFKLNLDLQSLRDILLLTIGGVAAALAVGLVHIFNLAIFGYLPMEKITTALVRYWVGDIIGVVTTAPLALVLWHQRQEIWPRMNDLAIQLVAVLFISWIVFGLEMTDEFKFFYLLFLPLIWMGVRHGLKGAVIGIAATQGAMMTITTFLHYEVATVTALQALMLVLALTTLLLAAVVDERSRAQMNLHDHQMSLAQMTRLSLAGEMASGLAHELNQPLTAIVNYIKAAQGLLVATPSGAVEAKDALDKASSQAMRASQIIGSLREFLRKGELELESIAVQDLVGEAMTLVASTARRAQVRLVANLPANLAKVRADRIHAEQVLLNLLINAIEAIGVRQNAEGEIVIEAAPSGDDMIEVSVRDNGPGIDPEIEGRLFEPFASSKNEGMGLGLMICRTIVEAHGGSLWLDDTIKGSTVFRFTLPVGSSNSKGGVQ